MEEENKNKNLNRVLTLLTILATGGAIIYAVIQFSYNAGANVNTIKNDSSKIEELNKKLDIVAETLSGQSKRRDNHLNEKINLKSEIEHWKIRYHVDTENLKQDLKEALEDINEWREKYEELKNKK